MSNIQKWSSKTVVKSITNDIINRNTGDNVLIQGCLNDVFSEATLITSQDITCSVNNVRDSIRLALGKYILGKQLSQKPIKGVFAEVVSTPENVEHFLAAISTTFAVMPQNVTYCIAIKNSEKRSEELTLWITN